MSRGRAGQGRKDIGHYLSRLARELRDPSQVLEAGLLFANSFCTAFFKVLIWPTQIVGTRELGSPKPPCLIPSRVQLPTRWLYPFRKARPTNSWNL